MDDYSSLCDDFYVNMNFGTEMELPANRETVLHFFERVQKTYPTMRNFYCRDRGDFVLEEDKDQGTYRWCTIEPRRVCSGQVNPASIEACSSNMPWCWNWPPIRSPLVRWIARHWTCFTALISPIGAIRTAWWPIQVSTVRLHREQAPMRRVPRSSRPGQMPE